MAQALCESKPDVGSSKKRSSFGLAASSTPIVVLLRFSMLKDPTVASRTASKPQSWMHLSTLSHGN